MNKREGLDDLATRFSEMVNELPNDGRERAMTVTIGGDNHGNITFGNLITINAAAESPTEERPLTDGELRGLELDAQRRYRQAWRRSRLNVPTFTILGVLIGLALWALLMGIHLVQGGPLPNILPSSTFPLAILAIGGVLILMMRWADRIMRLEKPILNEARAQIEMVRQTLHRRRVM